MFYRDLLNFHIRWNSILLVPIFYWFEIRQKTDFGRFQMRAVQGLSNLIEVVGFYSNVAAYRLVSGDMNVFCGWFSSVVHSWQTIFKQIYLRSFAERILDHFQDLGDSLLLLDKENFFRFYKHFSQRVHILQTCHIIMMACATTLYFGHPFLSSILKCQPGGSRILPIVAIIPFDLESCSVYQASIAFQAICFYCFNMKTIAIDYMVLGFINLHTAHLKFLKIKLMALVRNAELSDAELRNWTKQHQKALSSALDLQKILSTYLLIEYFYVIAHTCVPAFVITSTSSWTLLQKIALLFMVSGGMIILFALSKAGQDLSSVAIEIYEVPWSYHLCTNRKFRMTFTMLKELQSKPPTIHIGNLFPLCCPTFLAISKAIVTYYMALNEIQGLKSGS